MAEQSTFVKLDRNILRWGWYRDSATKAVFLHLLLTANVKPGKFKDIVVKRGQVVTSLKHLSQETGLSVSKVRTALEHLNLTQEITQQSTNLYTLITLTNYALYQDKPTSKITNESQTNHKQIANKSQQSKNNKKDITNVISKNGKNNSADAPPASREWERRLGLPEHMIGEFESEAAFKEFLKGR